ncbi:2-methylcitrate dehydratase PrpD [Mesorhizobium soli]|uniref:MmgE/PrpD family protein n=1 Tax=Pseudaminobacter soli (ex Li et al. 2025) TaxID=1295366 RepID=UPI0024752838|nr:MmgE/PrpD family protein [Mesorhizobium soli]MDH6233325.1 2-methylcitrate dehydratase PrpD [Mesorhizobium soli]
MAETVLTALAANIAATDFSHFPESTIRKAKLHILDTLGVSLAGATSVETKLVITALGTTGARGEASAWGLPLKTDARTAAFINGVSAHAFELDDSGGCDHSGAVVLPAVVAALEAMGEPIDGRLFLKSVLLGYEVGRRILEASGGYEIHNGNGWHSTGTCGTFGAAAAVATLMGLDREGIASALGCALSYSGGTWAFIHDGGPAKKLHAGRAAEGGYLAARLAGAGFQGPLSAFDDKVWGGFFQTFGDERAVPEELCRDFGQSWRLNRCSIKPHATCRGTHSAIDAIDLMLEDNELKSTDIAGVAVGMSGFQFGMCGHKTVTSRAQAQMSLPYAVAARLHYGKVSLAELEERAWRDPAIGKWLDRLTVRIDDRMRDEDEPSVEIQTRDGRIFEATIEHPLGGPFNPLSDERIIAKYSDLARIVLPETRAAALRDVVLDIDAIADMRPLIDLLKP